MTTLGSLIASKDFSGYKVANAQWSLEANQIEQLLYCRDYGDWSQGEEHEQRFFEAETLTAVAIDTWICTDTHVGLEILCVNGTPFALSWQTARKNDRDIMLIDEEGYQALQAAWERHRGETKTNQSFVSKQTLGLPVSGSSEKAYSVDTSSGLYGLSLDAHAIAQWMEDIKPEGGLSSISDVDTLKSCIAGVTSDIIMHERMIENTEGYLAKHAEETIKGRDSISNELEKSKTRVALLTSHLLTPLQARLAELEAL